MMREEDTKEIRQEFRRKRWYHAAAGLFLIIVGCVLLFVDLPTEHNHNIHLALAGGLIIFGGIFIDKGLTLDFIETILGLIPIRKGSSDESD